jgi:diadenosine tetraphosphate (Ap4A) HIT family hydrolase
MTTLIHRNVALCRSGQNPTTVCKLPSGWVVLGNDQFLRGYSLLLPDPVVIDVNALDRKGREQFLYDMTALGDALLAVTGAYRINYEILGNTEPALHAHVIPRYLNEPDQYRCTPPFLYPPEFRSATPFDPIRDHDLMAQIAALLNQPGN